VVRTITVPAIAAMVGQANWWPSKKIRAAKTARTTDRTDTAVAPRVAETPVQAVATISPAGSPRTLATDNIRRAAARRRRAVAQRGARVRRLSVAGTGPQK
jgi:putative drug exporter of the RND superfamily